MNPDMFMMYFRYLFVAVLALNVMLLFILFIVRQNHRANVFLSAFTACLSIPFVLFLFPHTHRQMPVMMVVVTLALTSVSAYGIFIYFYIRTLMGEVDSLGSREVRHFIGPCAVLLSAVGISAVTGERSSPPPAGAVLGVLSVSLSTVYVVRTMGKIRSYSLRIGDWFSDTEKVDMGWLKRIAFLAFALSLWWGTFIAFMAMKVEERSPLFPFLVMMICLIVGAISFITVYYVIRQPEIFRANVELKKYEAFGPAEADDPAKEKYAKQSLDETKLREYHDTLLSCMSEHKPFLDEELTISQLSIITDIPVHQLSIVINSMLGKNFSAFINDYRIGDAIALMSAEPDANLLSIAFRSGFNSKSAFNKIFKKVTGKTPSEYRSGLETR